MDINIVVSKSTVETVIPFTEGSLILVDKPPHWTSFDVVNKIRFSLKHKFGIKKLKVGHAGTLDPLATGLLLISTGKYTKAIESLQNQSKSYSGHIQLGAVTPTFDAESAPENHMPVPNITHEILQKIIAKFTGEISQVPPVFSAIKIEGKKAYQLARRGEEADLKPRQIHIYSLELKVEKDDLLQFQVHCSKGTYIRSLANDIGAYLGCGAFLSSLRRDTIGHYNVSEALQIPEVVAIIQNQPNNE